MIKGVNIPKPATINQNKIVSCPDTLLKQGIRYLVSKNMSRAAGMKIENDEIRPSFFSSGNLFILIHGLEAMYRDHFLSTSKIQNRC
jgi:hypothetical protein